MANILAIDDDEAMLVLIKNTLKKDGHDVTCISRITESLKHTLLSYEKDFFPRPQRTSKVSAKRKISPVCFKQRICRTPCPYRNHH